MRAAPEQGPIQVGTHLAACRKLTDKPSCRERDRARSRQAPGHACRVSLRFGATGRQSEIKVQTYDAVMRPVSFSLKSLQSRDMACAAVGGKSEFENKVDRSRIRSLTMFGKWRPFFIFDKMRFLRVLNLEGTLGLVNIMITKSILEGTSGLVNIGYVWLFVSFGSCMKLFKIIMIILFGWVNCTNLSRMKPSHSIHYSTNKSEPYSTSKYVESHHTGSSMHVSNGA